MVNKQLNLINTQNPAATLQEPKPYFTPKQTLPAYAGFRQIAGSFGLDISDEDINVVMLAIDPAPPAAYQNSGGYDIDSLTDEMNTWIMQALYSVSKVLPQLVAHDDGSASEEKGWHWEMPSLSDYGSVVKDGVVAFAVKDNRRFIREFFSGDKVMVKKVKGKWMIVFRGNAKLRKWLKGTTYSIEGGSESKVRIFKTYAKMMTDEGLFTRLAISAEGAAEDSPLNFLIIAPLDIAQYFFFDDDPHKQMSDLFVNMGIDIVNAAVAGIISTALLVFVGVPILGAGCMILFGVALTFLISWLALVPVEKTFNLKDKIQRLGREAEDHFIAQGDVLKIDFDTFSNESASALEQIANASITANA